MKNLLKDHIAELHNVTWPTRKQAIHAMITVISIMLLVGFFLSLLDSVLGKLIISLLNG